MRTAPLLLTLFVAALARTQSPPPAAFAFPAPSLNGAFGNLLRDRLQFTSDIDTVRATGRLGERDVRLDARRDGGAFRGKAAYGKDEVACSGAFDGEMLVLRLGDGEWRLQPEVELIDALLDLGAPEPDPARQWTVAVYLGGDNDLEPAAVLDLREMQKGMPANGCAVVALIDRFADEGESPEQWSDTRVLRVEPGDDGTFTTLGKPAERDTGDARTLASFVAGVFRKFPAKHHAVVLWDHGGGWTGMVVDEDAPGRKGRTQLSLGDVRSGLQTALAASGVLKLDLVAFDACLMAQLEVALAMHDVADFMVASQAIVPGSGFPYTQVLPKFGGDTSARDIAKAIVDEYGSFSEDAFKSGATLAAFDLGKAPGVAAKLDAVAGEALAAADQQWPALARGLFFAECYEVRQDRVGDNAVGSIDLLDLTERWRGIPGITNDALDALQLNVAALVLARYTGAERTLSKGLSIHGPHRAAQLERAYERTPLGQANRWLALLQRVHQQAARDQSPITVGAFRQLDAFGKPSTTAKPFGGDRLLFDVAGESIVEVQELDWQKDGDNDRWLLLRRQLVVDPMWPARWATAAAADMIDLVMPQFRSGKNELYHEISGLLFAITDGTLQTYGTLDMATPSTQAPITAIARFTEKATGAKTIVQVSFDRVEWNVVSLRPIERPAPGAVARSLEPVLGDTFEFWFDTRDGKGEEAGFFTPVLTWGESGLALVQEPDEPGRYRAEMVARSLSGRTATGSHDYELAANPDLEPWPTSWKDFDPSKLVGTWSQWKVTGPQQYADLKLTHEVSATTASNLFPVQTTGGPTGTEIETKNFWFFEWRGLPSLRIVTRIADGQKFGWYGPVRVDRKDGKLVMVMKAVNASGVVWEWRQQ